MGEFDFTTRPNRLQQQSCKWQASEDNPHLLQLWIADMDFEPLPAIRQVLRQYADEHIFGYPYASDSLYQAIIEWEDAEHGYPIQKEQLVLIEGVVPALSVAIQAFTEKGDSVLINTPVYPPFARTVKLNQRHLVANSLVERKGRFELDMEQLEKDLVENEVKLYIFCNPHNPGGRVWSKEEIAQVALLCQRHGVLLVSDEIHQDLTLFGHRHHSINTVSREFADFSILLSSATKTFNIAGTKNSFAVIENPVLRKKFIRQQLANNQHEIPTVGLLCTEAAYRHGKPWLEALKPILEANIQYLYDELTSQTQIRVMKPEGTYLVWLDFSAYGLDQVELLTKLREEAGVVLNDGLTFGKEGRAHVRFNAAAPFATIKEACQRLVRVFA